jgi:two-component system sensor histidine kinase PilS (NtrC family)
MTEIIHQHSNRINHIIEDILKLSRGSQTAKETITLNRWLLKFVDDFCLSNQVSAESFDLDVQSDNASIWFDAGHLNQIMTNLCNNARIHGNSEKPIHIKLFGGPNRAVNLEIADEGPGIEQQSLDKIFEPFYTTSHYGSGLGLYIVDQLCELNDATIEIGQNSYGGSSFTIRFAVSPVNRKPEQVAI